MSAELRQAEAGVLGWIDRDITGPIRDFQNPDQEWRRLFSELYGTFLLVIVAAGGGMISQAFPNTISRTAAVRVIVFGNASLIIPPPAATMTRRNVP